MIEHKQVSDDLHLLVSGRIGELDVGPLPRAHRVVVHLGEVTSLSSVGVRALERLFDSLAPSHVVLIHVAPAVAMQLKLLPSLSEHVEVQSARLPFVCSACGAERLHTVPWRADAHLRWAPECACGRPMVLDGLVEHFLPASEALFGEGEQEIRR